MHTLEIARLYHGRREIETAYFEVKFTIRGGRVLRARTPAGIEPEVWALLTAYQVLRTAIAATVPGTDPDRGSFTIALQAARDHVIRAAGITAGTGLAASPAALMPPGRVTERYAPPAPRDLPELRGRVAAWLAADGAQFYLMMALASLQWLPPGLSMAAGAAQVARQEAEPCARSIPAARHTPVPAARVPRGPPAQCPAAHEVSGVRRSLRVRRLHDPAHGPASRPRRAPRAALRARRARPAASSAKPAILHAYSTAFTWPISRAGQCRAPASDAAMTPVNQISSPALATSEISRRIPRPRLRWMTVVPATASQAAAKRRRNIIAALILAPGIPPGPATSTH